MSSNLKESRSGELLFSAEHIGRRFFQGIQQVCRQGRGQHSGMWVVVVALLLGQSSFEFLFPSFVVPSGFILVVSFAGLLLFYFSCSRLSFLRLFFLRRTTRLLLIVISWASLGWFLSQINHVPSEMLNSAWETALSVPQSKSKKIRDIDSKSRNVILRSTKSTRQRFCGIIDSTFRYLQTGAVRFSAIGKTTSGLNGKFLLSAADLPWEPSALQITNREFCAEIKLRLVIDGPWSYQGYLRRRGFLAYGAVTRLLMPLSVEPTPGRGLRALGLHGYATELFKEFGASESLDVLLGATLGMTDTIGDNVSDLFRELGITHLLVVSGFHVAILSSVVFAGVRWLLGRSEYLLQKFAIGRLSSMVALFVVCGTLPVVGASQPTFRSVVSLAVYLLGSVLGRKPSSVRAIGLSMIVTLLLWPGSHFEASFQLTFLSIFGLVVGSIWYQEIIRRKESQSSESSFEQSSQKSLYFRILVHTNKRLLLLFLTNTGAWLFTSPIIVSQFGIFVPLSVAINMLAIPIFSLVYIVFGAFCLVLWFVGISWGSHLLSAQLYLGELSLALFFLIRDSLEVLGLGSEHVSGLESRLMVLLLWLLVSLVALATLWQASSGVKREPLSVEGSGSVGF